MHDEHSPRGSEGRVLRRDLLVKGGGLVAAGAAAAVGATALTAGPAGAATTVPVLLPAGPARIFDTRDPGKGGRMFSGQEFEIYRSSPSGALGLLFNVTVTETLGTGWLSVFSAEIDWPGTSTVNWSGPGQNVANTAYTFVRPSDDGIAVRMGGGGSAQFVLDITGALVMWDTASPTSTAAADAAAYQAGPRRSVGS